MTDAGNIAPRIKFSNSDNSQTASFIFTDYDSYRIPAGIKLVGNQSGTWFEAESIFATTFTGSLSGNATSATKVIVNNHTTNDIEYPLVWSNQTGSSNSTENQLYKSATKLLYNPKNNRITAATFKGNLDGNVAWDNITGKPSAFSPTAHTHSYLPLSGGTLSGSVKSSFASDTWINSVSNSALTLTHTSFGGIFSANTKNGKLAMSTYPASNDNLYFGYVTNTHLSDTPNVNSYDKTMIWNAAENKLTATTFSGALAGNAASATVLQASRTINGTSFNGSIDITTANWGTSRNISIADSDGTNTGTAVSVNGGSAITLKLPSTIKASLTGNSATASKLTKNENLTFGATGLQYFDIHNDTGTANGAPQTNTTPTGDWYHIIRMNHGNSKGYFVDLATCFHSNNVYYRRISSGSDNGWVRLANASEIPTLSWTNITGKPTSFVPSSHSHNYVSLTGYKIYQYKTGVYTKLLTIVRNSNTSLSTALTFVWNPLECNRNDWGEFSLNWRGTDCIFHSFWKGGTSRELWVESSDGKTWNVWIKGSKDSYDPYGHVIVTSTYDISSYSSSLTYSDTAPASTYTVKAQNLTVATSANKLNTNAGSATTPVYFSNGVPVACSSTLSDTKYTAGYSATVSKIWPVGTISKPTSTPTNYATTYTSFTSASNMDTGTNLGVYFQVGKIYAESFWEHSDERLKENIKPVSDSDKIKNIELKEFNFKSDKSNKKKYGVIAQDVERAGLENLVTTDSDTGMKSVDYISLLILKCQQLEETINKQQKEIDELKSKL